MPLEIPYWYGATGQYSCKLSGGGVDYNTMVGQSTAAVSARLTRWTAGWPA